MNSTFDIDSHSRLQETTSQVSTAGTLSSSRMPSPRSLTGQVARVYRGLVEERDPREAEHRYRHGDDGVPGDLLATPPERESKVQVHGVDDPHDQTPRLDRVPPPVAAPRFVCPDGAGCD